MPLQSALSATTGVLHDAVAGVPWVLNLVAHKFGNQGVIAVHDAITARMAAGVDWTTILAAILPILLQLLPLLFGGASPVTLQQTIDAINAAK